MKLLKVLDFGCGELMGHSSAPEFESFVFLEEATGKSKEKILVSKEQIKGEDFLKFKNYLARRIKGEPWQYIIGSTNFLGFDIFTEKGVFIPRAETELMALQAVRKLKNFDNPYILEIGCGTGAISISIASGIRKAKIVATDISRRAVKLCKKNIDYHNLSGRINVVCADLLGCFVNSEKFDMIITNPPYIPENNLKQIDGVVKREPVLALNGGVGGAQIINEILKFSFDKLKNGGLIFIEIDSSNIPYIIIPEDLSCSVESDQYNRIRFLFGVKI